MLGLTLETQSPEAEWILEYTRICTFELESGIKTRAECEQFSKHLLRHDDNGVRYNIAHYKWVIGNGREVVHEAHIDGFGVGTFTVGVLRDNYYKGGVVRSSGNSFT